MLSPWLAPAVLTGIAGLVVSGASLFFVMRVDRRQRGADAPAVDVELVRSHQPEGVLELRIVLRNKTDSAWVLERIVFRDPDVSGALAREARVTNKGGGSSYTVEQAVRAAKLGRVESGVRVEPAGAVRNQVSWGDHAHEVVFLFAPSSLNSLSIRLSLRSLDAKPRSITIAAKRQVPPRSSSAID